jgi:spermidine synthase/tetratricopeptide (TPR) repeat protein
VFWKTSPLDQELVLYSEDAMASVAVVARPDGPVMKIDNAAGPGGAAGAIVEARLGLLPGLLLENVDRALCIGIGTGNTLMGLVTAGPAEVDCYEPLPGVAWAAGTFFHRFEEEVPEDTRLNVFIGDPRFYLASEEESYDLIVGSPVFPWRNRAGFYYSREHFTAVREHLGPGAVFCQWIPLHQLHWEDFGDIGYTFSEVFDNVAVFLASAETPYPVVGFVGSADPLQLDPRAMQARLDSHSRRDVIESCGMDSAMEILSLYLGNHWLFRAGFPDPQVNTLDRAVTEFRAARVIELPEVLGFNHFAQLAKPGLKESAIALLDGKLEGQERRNLELEIRSQSDGMREYLASHAYAIGGEILRPTAVTPEQQGELRRLREARVDAGSRAFSLAPGHRVLRRNLLEIWRSMIRMEELTVAANLMALGYSKLPEDVEIAYNWGLSYLLQEMYEEASFAFEKALAVDPDFHAARIHHAIALFCRGARVQAREELDRALEEAGGVDRLSELTRGLVLLMTEGVGPALPVLENFSREGPWVALIETAVDQARKSGAGGDAEDAGGNAGSSGDGKGERPPR